MNNKETKSEDGNENLRLLASNVSNNKRIHRKSVLLSGKTNTMNKETKGLFAIKDTTLNKVTFRSMKQTHNNFQINEIEDLSTLEEDEKETPIFIKEKINFLLLKEDGDENLINTESDTATSVSNLQELNNQFIQPKEEKYRLDLNIEYLEYIMEQNKIDNEYLEEQESKIQLVAEYLDERLLSINNNKFATYKHNYE